MTEEGEEPSPIEKLRIIRARYVYRDNNYLRIPRKHTMTLLAQSYNEWILQETKDILQSIDILKSFDSMEINQEIARFEVTVKEIQDKFARRIILPMKQIGQGKGGGKNEPEFCRNFQKALDEAFGTVQELMKIREHLTMITITLECVNATQGKADNAQNGYVA